MSNHQKRLSVPNSWPVERKTETFTVAAGAGPHGNEGVPLLVVLRDVLGYVDSKKEARYALRQGSIRINGEQATDEHRPIGMFDILAFTERDEYYRVFPDEGGRLALTPIEGDAADSKLGKVVGRQQVAGGETQLTLHDGETLLVDDDYAVNDSIVVANEGSDIVAHFPYEEDALVTAVQGGHAGEIGRVEEIQVTPGSASNNVIVSQEDGDGGTAEPSRNEGGEAAAGFETVEEYVVVIDENFVEGAEEAEAEAEAEEAAAEEADADAEDEAESEDEGGDEE